MTAAASQQGLLSGTLRLNHRVIIMYGVGDIANAIKVVTLGLYSLFFSTAVLGLPGTWIGVIAFVALLWDAVIDPYIGYLTDGACGDSRRYGFMLVGALTMGIGFWAFFSPPHDGCAVMLFAWLLVASLVLRTANSMYSIPYYALGARLSRDYHERTAITGIRGLANTIGVMVAASLSFVMFFPETTPGVDPKLKHAGYASMGLAFGLAMTIVALIAIWGTLSVRHRIASDAATVRQTPGDFFASMWDCLRNPSFRVLLGSFGLGVVGLAMSSALLLHFLTYYVKIEGSVALGSLQFAFYMGGLLGTVFWLRISRSFEKHRLYVLAAAVTSGLMMAALALFGEGRVLGTGDVRPLLAGYAFAGFFNCVLWFMPQSMLADVADENELRTGRRREGTLFGIFSFGQQIAAGVAVLLAGVLLDWFAGLELGTSEQSDIAAHRIAVIYSVIPSALFMTAAILMFRYELTRSQVARIQTQLQERGKKYQKNGLPEREILWQQPKAVS